MLTCKIMTKFLYYPLHKAHLARGTVVVIDVIRAFTTAAYAFNASASQIFPVSTVEEAIALKKNLPNSLTMGEVDGFRPPEFDFGNSPAVISRQNLKGKSLIQRTSAGTQGITRASAADRVLAASFVVASATAAYLMIMKPEIVSFIITGEYKGRDGDEDCACADYIQALMDDDPPDPAPFTRRVMTSTVGLGFKNGDYPYISEEDLRLSLAVNCFNFPMILSGQSSYLFLEKGKEVNFRRAFIVD